MHLVTTDPSKEVTSLSTASRATSGRSCRAHWCEVLTPGRWRGCGETRPHRCRWERKMGHTLRPRVAVPYETSGQGPAAHTRPGGNGRPGPRMTWAQALEAVHLERPPGSSSLNVTCWTMSFTWHSEITKLERCPGVTGCHGLGRDGVPGGKPLGCWKSFLLQGWGW